MTTKQPGHPRQAHPQAASPRPESEDANPRNVPMAPLDATPPQKGARKPARPATAGQDDVPMDTELLLDPPANAPDLGRERING